MTKNSYQCNILDYNSEPKQTEDLDSQTNDWDYALLGKNTIELIESTNKKEYIDRRLYITPNTEDGKKSYENAPQKHIVAVIRKSRDLGTDCEYNVEAFIDECYLDAKNEDIDKKELLIGCIKNTYNNISIRFIDEIKLKKWYLYLHNIENYQTSEKHKKESKGTIAKVQQNTEIHGKGPDNRLENVWQEKKDTFPPIFD